MDAAQFVFNWLPAAFDKFGIKADFVLLLVHFPLLYYIAWSSIIAS